jgi:hypothetical protein
MVSAVVLAGGAGRYNEGATYAQFKNLSIAQAASWYVGSTFSAINSSPQQVKHPSGTASN